MFFTADDIIQDKDIKTDSMSGFCSADYVGCIPEEFEDERYHSRGQQFEIKNLTFFHW